MFNETSYSGASYLGPPVKGIPGRGAKLPPLRYPVDPLPPTRCGPRDLGCDAHIPYGDDMAVPPTPAIGIPPVEGSNVGTGFDIGALLSGTTFGLPTWVLAAGAAWFFFFRGKR